MIFVKPWCYRAYESRIFSNWQITSHPVVAGLYWSIDENGAVWGASVRGSVRFWLAGGTGPRNFGKGER